MTTSPATPPPTGASSHDRLLDAAAAVFGDEGWRRLTMTKVADRAGVSRQTVYNEFGTKPRLAEELVMRELDAFLAVVGARFSAEDQFVTAVRRAVAGALELAAQNPLLRAILEGGHSGDSDLLPFLFQSAEVIDRATTYLRELVGQHHPQLLAAGEERVRVALESLSRLVLSHISQPVRSPQETADALAWLAERALAPGP